MSALNRVLRDAASLAAQLERKYVKVVPLPAPGQGISIDVFDPRTGRMFDVIVKARRD